MTRIVSLKARILMLIGSLIIILMMVISISILFQWRSIILENRQESALLVAQAFSVSILDALIYEDSGLFQNEGFLDNHIYNFLNKNEQVLFVLVYNQDNQIIVRSAYDPIEESNPDFLKVSTTSLLQQVQIIEMENYGWITEIVIPLQIYGKSWGTLRMGFDSRSTRTKIQFLFFSLFISTVLVAMVILAVIYFLTSRLTKSLSLLVSEMNSFNPEEESALFLEAGDDEIGILVSNFEKMKERLAESRKQLILAQKHIFQAEKLASIGRLASGVAHEINNPLNGIKNCLYAIEKEPENMAQTKNYLALANEGLEHIVMIVQKLLGFSRQQSGQISKIDLNEEVKKVLSLVQFRLEKKQIKIKTLLPDALPQINGDSHSIQEVIMNLLLNSIDSLDSFEQNGMIQIQTGLEKKTEVFLSITDNGPGIQQDDLDKIFDPFFTTKEEGHGTGLGLYVCLGIAEAHSGTIKVTSKPGVETTFYFTLPIGRNP